MDDLRSTKKLKIKNMAAPRFRNVDLDIESTQDLSPLEIELGERVFVLISGEVSSGRFWLHMEAARHYKNPGDTICALCSVLEKLSAKGSRVWHSARKKQFDIGFDAGPFQIASQFSLSNNTLNRLSKLGATLGVTFYYHPRDEMTGSPKRKRK
jgi:hypothetical protein